MKKKKVPAKIVHVRTIGVEKILVENFVSLQKVMTNLSLKFDNLAFQISKLLELFEKGHKEMGEVKKKIMLSHMHPESSIMEKFSKFVPPSSGVKTAIDKFKPDILICGHVHGAEGIEDKIGNTKIVNVGKKGWIFEV